MGWKRAQMLAVVMLLLASFAAGCGLSDSTGESRPEDGLEDGSIDGGEDGSDATPTPTPEAKFQYTVQPGDTLSGVAAAFGVGLDELLDENNMTLDSLIKPGDELTIPDSARILDQPGVSEQQADGSQLYTVQPGDSLSLIGQRFGVRLEDLLEANGLTIDSVITPGEQMVIPPN